MRNHEIPKTKRSYTGEEMAKKSLERQDSRETGRPMCQAIAKLICEGRSAYMLESGSKKKYMIKSLVRLDLPLRPSLFLDKRKLSRK
jgi:hypothetical protein